MPSPENLTHRARMTRKNVQIDHALSRAASGLYDLYYLYLDEHPELAVHIETMLLQVDATRAGLRAFQTVCWKSCPPDFDDVGDMPRLIVEARKDKLGANVRCRGYLTDLARGGNQLSSKRFVSASQLLKRSVSRDP